MFFAKVEKPIHLKGVQQELYTKINKKFGIKYGIYLVKDGYIKCENGDVRYRDYSTLFELLPTYKGHWDDTSPINKVDGRDFIMMDLFLDNGLLLERSVSMELHEVHYLSREEEGEYLLLCSDKDLFFQVIAK